VDHTDLVNSVRAAGHHHVDYIFCLNSTEQHWPSLCELIKPQGTICSIVETKHPVNLTQLQGKSASFVWEFMFTRSMYQTTDMIEQHHLLNELSELIDAGKIKTTVTQVITPINADNLRKAHAQLESGRTIGKVVLEHWQ
jgi:NADPH:quinone reductase